MKNKSETTNLFLLCYNLCVDANFDRKKLLPIINDMGLNEDSVKSNAIRYLLNDLKIDNNFLNKHFDFFISRHNAKLLFYYSRLIKYLIKEKEITNDNIHDYFWVSNNLEKVLLKQLHYICESVNWHDDLLKEKSREFSINYEDLLSMGINYRKIVLGENKTTINKHIASRKKKRVYVDYSKDLFNKLFKASDKKDIIDILTKINKLSNDKKMKLLEDLFNEADKDKIANIKQKIEMYSQTKKESSKTSTTVSDNVVNKEIKKAEELIKKFILFPSMNIEEFCKNNGILLQEFGDYLALVKAKNTVLFKEYLKKMDVNKRKH